MEIIQASWSWSWSWSSSNLQFLHLQMPALSLGFPHSSSVFSNNYNHTFHTPLPTSPLPPNPQLRLQSFRKPLSTTRSLPDEAASGSASNVVGIDSSLTLKKKAIEISSELKGTSIFLVGINNTIKTSLGKLLAEALRYYYFDSDSLVEEAAAGDFATKSFRETDEKGFHESETEVLKQLSSMGRLVVCAGNGAVQSAANLAFLRHGISIWIDVPLDMVARGFVEDGCQLSASENFNSVPNSEVMTQLTVMYEEMRGGYAIADATVSLPKVASQLGYDDLDAVTTEDMALEVLKEIGRLTRVKKMMEAAARPF
ncbi:probable inactive shikimate kinase like 1, chloroplastic isoform X2 [Cornus florida]|uniref:probable inactive shikimate kinase like 1, chloroplastic isoform X2 n=1 Tax=Cornus florida TaxID=4283 RepID=UPI0028A0025E|nr:probable inactive shikimate kinase like 1, chloroplastic isoform X2 [Cornus florida]